MPDTLYLALLRGINVGGNNLIKMADLKACLEGNGLTDVATFIQSGNALFQSTEKDKAKVAAKVEKALSEAFNYRSRVVIVTRAELERIVQGAPRGFGKDMQKYRYDVVFLRYPLTAGDAIKIVSPKEGVDRAYAGEHVLYFSRLISKASSSRLSRIIALPEYQNMTIRNWTTTTKLLELMKASAHKPI